MDGDAEYLAMAYKIALHSPDPSTQNGAVVVVEGRKTPLGGFNRFPFGVASTDARWEKAEKQWFVGHAECAAIYNAARAGVPTEGATLVCPWCPCHNCAIAIAMSGIDRVVVHKDRMDVKGSPTWLPSIEKGLLVLKEAGVELCEYSGAIKAPPIRIAGRLWSPATLGYVGPT